MPNAYPSADHGSYPGFRRLKAELLKQAEEAQKIADQAAMLDDIANAHWQLLRTIDEMSILGLIRLRREVRDLVAEAKARARTKTE